MLAMGGAQSGYAWLGAVMSKKATNLQLLKIENCGHFLPEEQPAVVEQAMIDFLK